MERSWKCRGREAQAWNWKSVEVWKENKGRGSFTALALDPCGLWMWLCYHVFVSLFHVCESQFWLWTPAKLVNWIRFFFFFLMVVLSKSSHVMSLWSVEAKLKLYWLWFVKPSKSNRQIACKKILLSSCNLIIGRAEG